MFHVDIVYWREIWFSGSGPAVQEGGNDIDVITRTIQGIRDKKLVALIADSSGTEGRR